MYMDPFRGDDHYCKPKKVAGRKGRELESILHCLDGVFGVSRETFQAGSGRFAGTLFWFPLRQSGSALSSTVYTQDNLDHLLTSFRAEASSLLLFLNCIQRVTIFTRDDTTGPGELFSVGIAPVCLQSVCTKRRKFVEDIRSAKGPMLPNNTLCVADVLIETCDHLTSFVNREQWLVVSLHAGQRDVSQALAQLCADPELSYRPYVGVAIPLGGQTLFQSQVFCFLPLPLETRSPTGLPVHVHGYFALSQNRRHVKWPAAQQPTGHVPLEPALRWNCLLLSELLPNVYIQALLRYSRMFDVKATINVCSSFPFFFCPS